MNVIFDHSEDAADHIKTFWFKPEKPVRYTAGQFTELYLPHPDADSRGQRRWFTLSSSPTDPLLSITTKFAPNLSSTFKEILQQIEPGTPLKLAEPMGDFVLPKDPTIPLLFVASGIGITPMYSMIKYLNDTGERRNIHLIYAVTRASEIAFEDLFNQYGVGLTIILKEPPDEYRGETGSLDADRILQLVDNTGKSLFYLSGPEPMVETFMKELKVKGIDEHRLVTDYFPGYTQF
jgi:glycine betaine catabolism B